MMALHKSQTALQVLLHLSQLFILASSVKEAAAEDLGMPAMRCCIQTLQVRSSIAGQCYALCCHTMCWVSLGVGRWVKHINE